MFRKLCLVCLVAYSAVVAWFTLRSLPFPNGSLRLIPFQDTWSLMRDFGERAALEEVAGNFALFVPLGFFLAATLPRARNVAAAIGVAAVAAIAIEGSQWLFVVGRSPSIDDVIYNTLGGGAGAVLFALLRGAHRFRAPDGGRREGDPPAPDSNPDRSDGGG